uniref:Rieske domain-containing protein n=1 Tax=Esox lucius TaxID=8010 RepID=A0A3P8ZD77_ESOLU
MEQFEEELVAALREIVKDGNWQYVGNKCDFHSTCTKLYSEDGEHIVLVHTEDDRFWAMDSSCPHEGGPLDLGDIEDLVDGRRVLVCPWHHFDFCLETGVSSLGLQNQIYEVRVVEDKIYVKTQNKLSLSPIPATNTRSLLGKISADDYKSSPNEDTLCFWATKILCTPDPKEKVTLTLDVQERWNSGVMTVVGQATPPVQPSRKDNLTVLQPGRIKRGKGGTQASRIALLHSLANIEQWAIDLSWDIIARFSSVRLKTGEPLPRQFFNDFVKVAGDEAKHYHLLETRITELGSFFGALPVHNGLWQSATDTSQDLLARLAIVHMVHEARGLDVHPQTLSRFAARGDCSTVEVLEVIYKDEITHVAAGLRWFTYICSQEERDGLSTFHDLVKQHFKGYLKPPFNTEGRKTAGMTEEWYVPLVKPSS